MSTVATCKFQLGDRVTNKQIGLPTVGNVVCVQAPLYFVSFRYDQFQWQRLFLKYYPDFIEKPVITIAADHAQNFLSFEEYWWLHFTPEAPESFIRAKYAASPTSCLMDYPEDDLELL